MRKFVLISAALLLFQTLQIPLHGMVRAGVDVDNNDDDGYYYDEDWDGPGFYFGIWFGNEGDYYNWRRGHYYYSGGHYHNDGHHGHDHDHGGGHGGGHHGGGHH